MVELRHGKWTVVNESLGVRSCLSRVFNSVGTSREVGGKRGLKVPRAYRYGKGARGVNVSCESPNINHVGISFHSNTAASTLVWVVCRHC